jgi:predicted DsbA family dithiol-disulfide isomerase
MRTGKLFWLIASLSALSSAACERGANVEAGPTAASPVVAEYGDVRITLAEIDASARNELYRLRGEALHGLLMQRLERVEAKKRGISVEQLRDQGVESRLERPSEVKIQAVFAQSKAQGMLEPDATLETARDGIVEMLTMGRRRELQEEYFDELLLGYGVRMHFDVIGRPKVAFRDGGPSVGPAGAPITIVEFTDFNGRFCPASHDVLAQVVAAYPEDVRVLFRHKPEPDDQVGRRAAEAALCAHEQGRYWDFRVALFRQRGELSVAQLVEHASGVGLDAAKFRGCVDARTHRAAVQADVDEAKHHGLDGSPVAALNGTPLSGVHDFRFYRRLIELQLPRREARAAAASPRPASALAAHAP